MRTHVYKPKLDSLTDPGIIKNTRKHTQNSPQIRRFKDRLETTLGFNNNNNNDEIKGVF